MLVCFSWKGSCLTQWSVKVAMTSRHRGVLLSERRISAMEHAQSKPTRLEGNSSVRRQGCGSRSPQQTLLTALRATHSGAPEPRNHSSVNYQNDASGTSTLSIQLGLKTKSV